jgi:hypothetical protein
MKRLIFAVTPAVFAVLASPPPVEAQSACQLSGAICYGQQQQAVVSQQYVQQQAVYAQPIVVQRVVTPYVQQQVVQKQVVQKVVAQPVYVQAQVVQQVNAGYGGSSQAVVVGRQKARGGILGLGAGRQRTVQRSVTKTRG